MLNANQPATDESSPGSAEAENVTDAKRHIAWTVNQLRDRRTAERRSVRRDAAQEQIGRQTLGRVLGGHVGVGLTALAHVGLLSGQRLTLRPYNSTSSTTRDGSPAQAPPSGWTEGRALGADAAALVTLAGTEIRHRRRELRRTAQHTATDALIRSERTVRRWESGDAPTLWTATCISLSLGLKLVWEPVEAPWQAATMHRTSGRLRTGSKAKSLALYTDRCEEWATPGWVVDSLSKHFGPWGLDAAATASTAVGDSWLGPDHPRWIWRDALAEDVSWAELSCGPIWLNPPYGDITAWLEKAMKTAASGRTVVALLAARTDTTAWHDLVLPHADVCLLRGRLRFRHPDGSGKAAPFPSAVVVWSEDRDLSRELLRRWSNSSAPGSSLV